MRTTFNGYVMSVDSWFDYFCVSVLSLHAIIALGHIVSILVAGKTSNAWDTIVELLSLAFLSPVPQEPLLRNASAGIKSQRTLRLQALIEAPGDAYTRVTLRGNQIPAGELRLRLDEFGNKRRVGRQPVIGQVYGRA